MGGVAGDSLGRIMERTLGEEGAITNNNGLTLATRWYIIVVFREAIIQKIPEFYEILS